MLSKGTMVVCQNNYNMISNLSRTGQIKCSNLTTIIINQAQLMISTPSVCPAHFERHRTRPSCKNLVNTDVTSDLSRL